MRHLSNLVIALVLLSPLQPGAAEPASYAVLLGTYLADISTLSAKFEQNTFDRSAQESILYKGQLWIEKPNRFRVDTVSPSLQTLVSNGVDFWSYDEDLEQVVISELNKDLKQVPILLFSSDIASIEKAYTISGYTDENGEHFLLQPLSDVSFFQSLTLAFHLGEPVSITINATTGQTTTISLSNIVLNADIPAGRFSFIAPVGADVIDDRN